MKTIVATDLMRQIVSCGIALNRNSNVMMEGVSVAVKSVMGSSTVAIKVMKRIVRCSVRRINLSVPTKMCVWTSEYLFFKAS